MKENPKKKEPKEMSEIIITGWKSIGWACGIMSVSTIKGIAQKYNMPVHEVNGKPIITKEDLLNFIRKLPAKKY